MKITMYELLGLVRDDIAPKKIKFENNIYSAYYYENKVIDYYYTDELKNQRTLFDDSMRNYGITSYLNDEVEILEEEKKIPEKLNLKLDDWTTPTQCDIELSKKIDEIIDYLDYFKSKGE